MAIAGVTRTITMRLCAPIPVGHDVVVQYWERDMGIFGQRFTAEESKPSVLDRTTGIGYGAPWHAMSFFGLEPGAEEKTWKPRPAQRVEGTVRACAVFTENGNEGDRVTTVLTVEARDGYR